MPAYAALFLLLAACGASGPQEDIVARVGDAYLEASALEALLPYDASAEDRRRALDDWIGRELLYREALQRQLHEDIRLQQQLERTRRNLLLAALLDDEFGRGETDVSEGEIRQHYDEHLDLFQREEPEVRVRHILLASQRQANARRADLRRGADFADVARSHSEDVDTRSRGGELDALRGDLLLGQRAAGGFARIDNRRQFDSVLPVEQSSMNASQMSGPDNSDSRVVHAALLRSRPRPFRPSC